MTELLRVGDQIVTEQDIIPLLAGYRMLPQLLQEILIDQAIAPFTCTPEEQAAAQQRFAEQNQITSPQILQAWLNHHGMTLPQLEALTVRELRIEKFKRATWGNKLESYFLSRKGQLDKVIYSLIRTKELEVAQELYFRIQEGEQTFAELARQYSLGPEAQTDGLIGPVELSTPHPSLARLLGVSQPGQLWAPTQIGEWVVIVRLEKFIPAQMDDGMQQRLLQELFQKWLQEQISQLSAQIQPPQPQPSLAVST
jgi:parvulin-like peptidyl-prolyl isomerase